MKRITYYGIGLVTVAILIALLIARDRLLNFVFDKLPNWASFTLVFGLIVLAIGFALWSQMKVKPPPSAFCVKCGYDLRATPDRCPECGTVPPEKRRASNK